VSFDIGKRDPRYGETRQPRVIREARKMLSCSCRYDWLLMAWGQGNIVANFGNRKALFNHPPSPGYGAAGGPAYVRLRRGRWTRTRLRLTSAFIRFRRDKSARQEAENRNLTAKSLRTPSLFDHEKLESHESGI
jgi:hypothetical protein